MNRKLVYVLAFIVFLTNTCCGSQASIQKSVAQEPKETLTPVPTAILTPKPTVTPTPTLTPSPTEVRSDFERGVKGDLTEVGKFLEQEIYLPLRTQGDEYIYYFEPYSSELFEGIPALEIGNGQYLYSFYPADEENGYDKSLLIFKGEDISELVLAELDVIYVMESGGYTFVVSNYDLDSNPGYGGDASDEQMAELFRRTARESFFLGNYRDVATSTIALNSCRMIISSTEYTQFDCIAYNNGFFDEMFVGFVGLSSNAVNKLLKSDKVVLVATPTPTIPPTSEVPFSSENGTQAWEDLKRLRSWLAQHGAYLRFEFSNCENTAAQIVVYRGSSCYIVSDIQAYGMEDENPTTAVMDYRVTVGFFAPAIVERGWYSLGSNAAIGIWVLSVESDWALLPEEVFGFSDERIEKYRYHVNKRGGFPVDLLYLVGTIGLTEDVAYPFLKDRGFGIHEYQQRK